MKLQEPAPQRTGCRVAVSKCVIPQKLSSNQYLLHCASGSGESVGDLSEQCDFSVCIHSAPQCLMDSYVYILYA